MKIEQLLLVVFLSLYKVMPAQSISLPVPVDFHQRNFFYTSLPQKSSSLESRFSTNLEDFFSAPSVITPSISAPSKEVHDAYNESPPMRAKNLFLISYPFTTLLTFLAVKAYLMLLSGQGAAEFQGSHVATVVLGGALLSSAVAYRGTNYYLQQEKDLLLKSDGTGKTKYQNKTMRKSTSVINKEFMFSLVVGQQSF